MRVKYTGRSKTTSTISIERIWSHLLRNPKWKTSLFVQWFRFNMRYFLSLLTSVNYWETYEINLWFLCRAFSSFVWVRFWCELLLLLSSSLPLLLSSVLYMSSFYNIPLPQSLEYVVISCGTNNLATDDSEKIADDLFCIALALKKGMNLSEL